MAKNPLKVLELSPWYLESILPWGIVEYAKIARDAFARCWRPDITTDQKKIRRFRDVQEAYTAISIARPQQLAAWLKSYLRQDKDEMAISELETAVNSLRRQISHWRTVIQDCLAAQVDSGPCISAWHTYPQPACEILLARARVHPVPQKINIALDVDRDGSIICWDLEKIEFRICDGMPELPQGSGWSMIHRGGPNHKSYFYRRAQGTARPFPFRLIGSIQLIDALTERIASLVQPASNLFPPDDPFIGWGAGMDLGAGERVPAIRLAEIDDFSPWLQDKNLHRSVWSHYILLSRLDQAGQLKFWLVGPAKEVRRIDEASGTESIDSVETRD